jgi:hypothetical protein
LASNNIGPILLGQALANPGSPKLTCGQTNRGIFNTGNNRLVASATAEVALEGLLGLPRQFSRTHDHPGGAKAALETLVIEKLLLESVIEATDGGDLPTRRSPSRVKATVDCFPINPDSAGPTITSFTNSVDFVVALVAQPAQKTCPRRTFGY